MTIFKTASTQIDQEYLEHRVFSQLTEYGDFYMSLSVFTMGWLTQGTRAFINLDSYVYSSMKGTLESIKDIFIERKQVPYIL